MSLEEEEEEEDTIDTINLSREDLLESMFAFKVFVKCSLFQGLFSSVVNNKHPMFNS